MRTKKGATEKIITLLRARLNTHPDVAAEVAEAIFHRVVEVAVEEERNEWILMSKSAPDGPDGRGYDS